MEKKEHLFEFDSSLYNMFDELITYTDLNGKIIDCNKAFLNFVKKKRKHVFKEDELELMGIEPSDTHMKSLLKKGVASYEQIVELPMGYRLFFITKHRLVRDKESGHKTLLTIRQDITKSKTNFIIYKEYKKLLKHISEGKSLTTILDSLVKSIEKKNPKMLCSVLLLDKSGQRLFSGAAPSLPQFYVDKISGMQIGEKVGSCGAAAFLRKRVIVEDIQVHENWQLAKNLANKANLQACWSQPIFSSKSEVLGTFAIYYERPRKPTKFDIMVIKDAASIAGIAIEKHKNEYQISRNYENEKKQEQLLMHKSKQAMMGEMLENIAHQWRQPLSAISTAATGIQVKRELGSLDMNDENEALENINLNAQYLSQTIEDFRLYFKSESDFVQFNIKDAYYHTLKLVSARLRNANIQIIEDISDIYITSLDNELTQVLINILNNSIDEFERSNIEPKIISVKIHQEHDEAVIRLIDSAGGADMNIINRIFEPYFTTKHKSHGTGIGLYMCKEIIEKHIEGSIEARNSSFKYEDKRYDGLEFIITIPIS